MQVANAPILLVAAVCVSTAANARTCLVLPPEPRDLNQIVERVVKSLELLKDGRMKNATAGSTIENWAAGSAKDAPSFDSLLTAVQQPYHSWAAECDRASLCFFRRGS